MSTDTQEQLGALLDNDRYEKDDFTVVSQPFLEGVQLPRVRLIPAILRSFNHVIILSLHNRRVMEVQISPILLQTVSISLPNRRQSRQRHSGITWYSIIIIIAALIRM